MHHYPHLESYLQMPQAPGKREPNALLQELLAEVSNQPILPFEERFMYDAHCNQRVFHALWFPIWALMRFADYTQLLPREILGINSLRIVLTHDPCMLRLAEHIRANLNRGERDTARDTIKKLASMRATMEGIFNSFWWADTHADMIKHINHLRVCHLLKLPMD